MQQKRITASTIGLIMLFIALNIYFIALMEGKQIENWPYLILLAMSLLYLIAVYDIGFTQKKSTKITEL